MMSFVKIGSQHTVNTTIAGDQEGSAVTQLLNGDIVVAWTDRNGSAINVRGQILSSDGVTKEGSEFMLNTTLTGDQFDVALTALGDGGFAAAWTSSSSIPADFNDPLNWELLAGAIQNHIVTQSFNASGTLAGGESIRFNEVGYIPELSGMPAAGPVYLDRLIQSSAALAADLSDTSGEYSLIFSEEVHAEFSDFVVPVPPVWENYKAGQNSLITDTVGDRANPYMWEVPQEGALSDATMSTSFFVPGSAPEIADLDKLLNPRKLILENGLSLIAYWRQANASNEGGVFLDFYRAAGTVHVGSDNGIGPSIAQLTNGNVVAVWSDTLGSSDGNEDIRGQLLTEDGTKIGGEFVVTNQGNDQWTPEVAALTDGRFLVVWEDRAGDGSGSSIKAQLFSEDGIKSGEAFTVNTSTAGDQIRPTVTALANGDALVTWTDTNGATNDIYSQMLDLQTYEGDGSDETVYGGSLADHLDGGDGADALYGNGGNDVFESVTPDDLSDGDILDGGAGIDTLDFDDYVVELFGPPVLVGDNGTIKGVEVINLYGPSAGAGLNAIDIAIPLANNTSNNTLTVNGALAQDIIYADRISNTAVLVTLNGGGGDDFLYGGAGGDTLNGGTGSDYMEGGSGGDTYHVDSTGDTVVENPLVISPGVYDTVIASVDYTIASGVEHLTLSGSADIDGTGNSLNNIIYGNGGSNRLEGLGGQDHVYGLGGFDYLYGGTSTDWLYGGAGDDNLYGEDGGDVLVGGTENDELDGGLEADYMQGGTGDDLYVVDNIGDQVVEYNNQGTDIVLSSITAIAPAYTENLWLIGTANISGVGNLQDNMIVGNSGINTLSGVIGNDMLYGFGGSDLLWGGSGGDTMDGGDGLDTVTYAGSAVGVYADIGANLYFGGDANGDIVSNVENLIGSALDDTLVGDGNNNWLTGGTGIDTLAGGGGNDTYVIDNALDVIIEIGGGIDTVLTSLTNFTLAPEVEKLIFTSALVNVGTGNALNNTLTGNTVTDTLTGLSGDDTLIGRDGNDVLRGGAGADVLNGGLGIADLADYLGATASIVVALDGSLASTGEAAGDTFVGVERLRGSNFDDTLAGDNLDNYIFGQNGIDTMSGLDGADRITGGIGADSLTGGAGGDFFQYTALTEIGDAINDFAAVDDTITVTGISFGGGLVAGTLNAAFFQSRADNVAQDADDRFIYRTIDETLWFDADGNGAGTAVLVADLQAGATMTNADILVV
jgi:Ca2+-binding RTX toxin-like protein